MTQFNKATAAVVAGAVVTIVGALLPAADPTLLGAVQTVITAGLVWLVPNIAKE